MKKLIEKFNALDEFWKVVISIWMMVILLLIYTVYDTHLRYAVAKERNEILKQAVENRSPVYIDRQ